MSSLPACCFSGYCLWKGKWAPDLSLMCTGCADWTKPTSVLWLNHKLDGTWLNRSSCSAVSGICVGSLWSTKILSAVPSSYVLTEILICCLSEEMWMHALSVGFHSKTCIAALTIGLNSCDSCPSAIRSVTWGVEFRTWNHSCSSLGSSTKVALPCGPR